MKSVRLAMSCSVVLVSCGGSTSPLEAYGSPPSTFSIVVGQEARITVRTIGPGSYNSPPVVAGSSVVFVREDAPDAQVPAGPTQVFVFRGVERGQSIVGFHNTNDFVLSDTIIVR